MPSAAFRASFGGTPAAVYASVAKFTNSSHVTIAAARTFSIRDQSMPLRYRRFCQGRENCSPGGRKKSQPMDPPSVEDRPIWDLWLSQYRLPVVLAADQLGLFEFLRDRPATIDEICHDLKLLRRSADALTAALASTGFLVQHGE